MKPTDHTIILHHAADYVRQPWKNGQGETTEIARSPGAAFIWRLSMADITRDGAFSDFTGLDRTFLLLEGAGVRLYLGRAEVAHQVDQTSRVMAFDGGMTVRGELLSGPVKALNIMTRQSRVRHHMEPGTAASRIFLSDKNTIRLLFSLDDGLSVLLSGRTYRLGRHDMLELTCDSPTEMRVMPASETGPQMSPGIPYVMITIIES